MSAALAGAAVLVTVVTLRPTPAGGAGAPTVVVVRDIAAGQVVAADDLEVVLRPSGQRPVTALSAPGAAVGRSAAGPLTTNEVLTPERLVGGDLLVGQPAGRVALSVPVLDAASVGVRPGNRIDLYATGSGAQVATDVVVLAVHDAEESAGLGASAPSRLTLALDPEQASEVARGLGALESGQSLVIAIRHTAPTAQ